jgi:N-methylhydantoinase A
VIAFDMGGTTAKTSLVKDGEVSVAQGYPIGGYASGHYVMLPVVDIVEVGAGGGSIAWIDEVGGLKVGPQSAGADPGPISYRRGGTEPTVTDANVVLGRIGASSFLGGEMPLDAEGAGAGIAGRLCAPLGLTPIEAAHGILKIAVAKMSLAVRGVSVERGYDPRDFALVGMGGAGPLHAPEIARDLHIPRVIIPNLPAHFSALGMLMTDLRHDYVRTYYRNLLEADLDEVRAIFNELIEDAGRTFESEGVDRPARSYQRFMDLRYLGQEFWLQIPVSEQEILGLEFDAIRARFDGMHDRRFGHAAQEEPLELVNLRLTARGARPKITFPKWSPSAGDAQTATRPIYLEDPNQQVECAVYRRDLLAPGARVNGPCVIEEYASTTVIFEGDRAQVAETGELLIEVGGA